AYLPTWLDEQRTPYGHASLLFGLHAWADRNPRARALYEQGLGYFTERHTIHSLGTTGVYHMAFPDEGLVQFGTNAEVGGTFLLAVTFAPERMTGRWTGTCSASAEREVSPR